MARGVTAGYAVPIAGRRKEAKHTVYETYDSYAFPLQISDYDLYLFNEGKLRQAYQMLGAQHVRNAGVDGMRFSVWAPNAGRVSVVGDFNRWDGRTHPMAVHHASGVWELFIPGILPDSLYKYEICNRDSGEIVLKTDPYANRYELRPNTAALTPANAAYDWCDAAWIANRTNWDWLHAPLNILEMHAGSWKRHPDGRFYTYRIGPAPTALCAGNGLYPYRINARFRTSTG